MPTRSQSDENEIWLIARPHRPGPPTSPTWALSGRNSVFSWYMTAESAAKLNASAVMAVQLPKNSRAGRWGASATRVPLACYFGRPWRRSPGVSSIGRRPALLRRGGPAEVEGLRPLLRRAEAPGQADEHRLDVRLAPVAVAQRRGVDDLAEPKRPEDVLGRDHRREAVVELVAGGQKDEEGGGRRALGGRPVGCE